MWKEKDRKRFTEDYFKSKADWYLADAELGNQTQVCDVTAAPPRLW